MTQRNEIPLLQVEGYKMVAKSEDTDLLFVIRGQDIYFESRELVNVWDQWARILQRCYEKNLEEGPRVY